VSGASFKWVFWVLAIFAGSCFFAILFTLPESYEPVLLLKLAEKKRRETGDKRYYAPLHKVEVALLKRVENILIKPFRMFVSCSSRFELSDISLLDSSASPR
jgi:hypothetical protein